MQITTCSIILALAAAFTLTQTAYAAVVSISPDRMLEIDGKRTFILGLYENPENQSILNQVREAGFNMVRSPSSVEYLDKLWNHGLYAWLNTGYAIDLSEDKESRIRQLNEMAASFADHPALLVWEVPDEALWNIWLGCIEYHAKEKSELKERLNTLTDEEARKRLDALEKQAQEFAMDGDYEKWEAARNEMRGLVGLGPIPPQYQLSTAKERTLRMAQGFQDGYATMKKIDPNHPIWMNHAPRNSLEQLALFSAAADIVGCDIYPVPSQRTGHSDIADISLSSVGAYTQRMQASGPGKPVWMVLQGFGWGDLFPDMDPKKREEQRRPTRIESRFMAYDAIVHGARGILYWGTHAIEKESQLWKDLLDLVRELSDIQHVLSAPDHEIRPAIEIEQTWGSVDRGIVVLPKNVEGKLWLIVVNEWPEPIGFTMSDLQGYENSSFVDCKTGKKLTVKSGNLHTRIPGYGVYVFENTR